MEYSTLLGQTWALQFVGHRSGTPSGRGRRAIAPRVSGGKLAHLLDALAVISRHFNAALASLVAVFMVFFAVLPAVDMVLAALFVAPETVLAAVRVALRTAPFTIRRAADAGGLRRMPCALSKALTASDSSLTRSLRRSTSEEV